MQHYQQVLVLLAAPRCLSLHHPLARLPIELLRLLLPFLHYPFPCYRLGPTKYLIKLPHKTSRTTQCHVCTLRDLKLEDEHRALIYARGRMQARIEAHATPLPVAFLDSRIEAVIRPYKSGKRHTKRGARKDGKKKYECVEGGELPGGGGVLVKQKKMRGEERRWRGGNKKARRPRFRYYEEQDGNRYECTWQAFLARDTLEEYMSDEDAW